MKTSIEIPQELYSKVDSYIFSKNLNLDKYILSLIENDIKKGFVCKYNLSHTPNSKTENAIRERASENLNSSNEIWKD